MEYVSGVRRVLGCVLGLSLALTACNSDDEEGAAPPRATVATATSTTTPADPYAIPATIDVAYVQRVLDKLYEIEAEAAAEIVREREIVRTAAEKLASIYFEYQLNQELRDWQRLLRSDPTELSPARLEVKTRELRRADTTCIIAAVELDSRSRFPATDAVSLLDTVLIPKGSSQLEHELNPTPWVIRLQAAGGPAGEPLEFDACVLLPQE